MLPQLGFAGSVSTEASSEQAAGLSKAVSTLAYIHTPWFSWDWFLTKWPCSCSLP